MVLDEDLLGLILDYPHNCNGKCSPSDYPQPAGDKYNMKTVFLILASMFLLCGCEPCPHYNRLQVAAFYGPGAIPPRKPRLSVVPFDTAEEVGRPFGVIGFMSCEGSVGEEGGILKAMLYRAADMGADAIILNPPKISQEAIEPNGQKMNVNVTTGLIGEMIGNNSDKRAYRAEAILFTTTNAP
jgi:hypothetical protein